MISVGYLSLFLGCLVFAFGQVQQQEEGAAPIPREENGRPLMAPGFLRYGDPYFVYPTPEERRVQPLPKNPTFTNEIDNGEEPKKPPVFIYTTYDAPLRSHQLQPDSGPYIEIRKKRNVEAETPKPETGIVGLLRKKRSHCSKCGGGGYGGGGYGGGYYPVAYQAYPVYTSYVPASLSYYPSYGGGGGCNTCGKGFGGGGGRSGSWSKSSSSSKSSSGSWGYGK